MCQKQGFTLIELLVVVLIIGILSAAALPQYQVAVEKARVARMLPVYKSILNAQEIYEMANGEGTDDLDVLDISVDYVSKDPTDAGSMRYTFSDGSNVKLDLNSQMVVSHFKAGYVIDYYGKATRRGNVSGSGLCYPYTEGGLAERVCKSIGTQSSVKSITGTNVYVFSY